MNELVTIQNEQAVTSSRIVAEKFEKRHADVIRAIENIKAENCVLIPCYFETSYQAGTGKHYKEYLMNQKGFSILVMGFTGKKARQWQSDFYDAFESTVKELQRIKLNRENAHWQEIRSEVKRGYRELTDAVKQLAELAKAQGSKSSEKIFYMNFAKLINKNLGIEPKSRDTLEIWQLHEIEKLQFMASCIIKGNVAKSADYHLPYRDSKQAFENYARLSYINQRFLN